MSIYALVHYPRIDTTEINAIRDEHDPYRDLIDVHITIVFPVPVDREALEEHIEATLANWQSFAVHLEGLHFSFDRWLFLTVEHGNEKLIRLFADLYKGLLAPHRRHDIEYIPHIGLGYFGAQDYNPHEPTSVPLDESRYEAARSAAEAADLDYETVVDRLTLVELDDEFTQIEVLREFAFGSR